MKKQLLFLFSSLLLLSIYFNVGVLAETKYQISGHIYEKDGKGASGIKLEILKGDEIVKSVKTDKTGKYKIDVMLEEEVEHKIRLSKDKYQTQTHYFTSPDKTNKEIEIIFTINKIPVAKANGGYESMLLTPITFDSQGTSDPDEDSIIYDWSFGDEEHSSEPNPTHTYLSPGEFTVTLIVTDVDGAIASDDTKCTVKNQQPIVILNGPYEVKIGNSLNFDPSESYDPDGEITSYQWDFGDGTSSTEENPIHVYSEKGDYTIKLKVADNFGSESEKSDKVTVLENQPPIADAKGPYSGYIGEEILFDGSGIFDPDDNVLSIIWEFGDGSNSNEEKPKHVYQEEGTFSISLTITDEQGASDTDSSTCTVLPPIPKPPTVKANGPYSGQVGEEIHFSSIGSFDPDNEIVEYSWDFGDGDFSTNPSPVHVYTIEGLYSIILTITDETGLSGTENTECAISKKESRYSTFVSSPNEKPVAQGNGPYTGTTDTIIEFNSNGSYDSDGEITQYLWSFGDGGTSEDPTPEHVYDSVGSFDVSLLVSDGDKSNKYTTLCTIVAPNIPPHSSINGPYEVKVGHPIEFESTGSNDPDGEITGYLWKYGDSVSSTRQNPTHKYQNPGNYIVTLTVWDNNNASHISMTNATVNDNISPLPVLEGPKKNEISQAAIFKSTNSYDPDGEISECLIDFGDGTFALGSYASHIYSKPGNYTVTLKITDNDQEQQIASYELTVYENKSPEITSNGPYYASEEEEIEFNPSIHDPDGWISRVEWSFGDGKTSEIPNPTHSYQEPGEYLVQITITDNLGKQTIEYTNAIIERSKTVKFPIITSMVIVTLFSTYFLEKKYQFY